MIMILKAKAWGRSRGFYGGRNCAETSFWQITTAFYSKYHSICAPYSECAHPVLMLCSLRC